MKKSILSMSVVIVALFAGTSAADIPAPNDASAVCFTEEYIGMCGRDHTGELILCEDGTGGPSYLRVAEPMYKCADCPTGQSGQRKCVDMGKPPAEETLTIFGCKDGTYTQQGDPRTTKTCNTAQLSGRECP